MKVLKNKNWLLILSALFLMLSVLFTSTSVLAEDKGKPYIKSEAKEVDGVVRESTRYDDSQFDLMTYVDEGILPSFNEAVEGWQKKIKSYAWEAYLSDVNAILTVVYHLFSFDIATQFTDQVANVMKSISETLIGQLLTFFMSLFAIGVLFRGFWKQDFNVMFSIILKGILAIALLFSISYKPATYFNIFNSLSTGIENAILKVNPTLSDKGSFDVGKGFTTPKQTGILVENKVYEALKYKPYLRVQYGTSDEKIINNAIKSKDDYGVIEGKRNRITNYLESNPYTEAGIEKRQKITEQEYQVLENRFIGANSTSKVVVQLFQYNINAMVQLLFYVSLAIIRIGLQFGFLFMMLGWPLMLILSLMPAYENLWIIYLKGIFQVGLFKALTVFFILLTTSILSVGYAVAAQADNVYDETFTTFIYIAGTVYAFLKRKFIFDMIKDAYSTVNNKTTEMAEKIHHVTKSAPKHAGNVAVATMKGGIGAGVVTGLGGEKLARTFMQADRDAKMNKAQKLRAKEQKMREKAKKADLEKTSGTGVQNSSSTEGTPPSKAGSVVPMKERKIKNVKGSQNSNPKNKSEKTTKNEGTLKPSKTDVLPSNKSSKNTDVNVRVKDLNEDISKYNGTKRDRRVSNKDDKPITKWEAQQQINHQRKIRTNEEAKKHMTNGNRAVFRTLKRTDDK